MTEPGGSRPVLVERHGPVMIVTINRPETRNAIDAAVWTGLGNAIEDADRDAEVRVVILTGCGELSFCAGADLKAVARGGSSAPDDPAKLAWGFAGIVSHTISKPLIAAVNGTALGGGTEIVLACDLVVAADNASFGLPEVKRGVVAGAGGAFRIVRQLPKTIAMELLLTGDAIDAARAYDLGLVNVVVPRAQLLDAALALARRVAANAPLSVQASKRIALGIIDGDIPGDDTAWAHSRSETDAIMQSDDAREGLRAFAEKRAPIWKGR